MSKILSRFDKTLNSSPGLCKTTVPALSSFLKPSGSDHQKSTTSSKLNLKDLYYDSIGKLLKPTSPTSSTPDITLPITPAKRSKTPTLSKNSTQILKTSKFQPKLNKNSLKIASRLGSSHDRLTTSTPRILPIPDENFSFHPEINNKSKLLSSSRIESKHRWEALYANSEEKREKIEQLKSILQLKETDLQKESCVFKPQILQPSVNVKPTETVNRLNNWARVKEMKLKEKKDNEIDKDLKECTFAPKIIELQGFAEQVREIKGLAPYINRGKRLQIEKPLSATLASNTQNKDINKKQYSALVQALHNELLSLDI